jgi:hypothetical protein
MSGLIAGNSWAEALRPQEVSADAKWAAHLDFEHLLSSRLGKLFKDTLEKEGELRKIEALGTAFEFDPFKDLHSVTVYGTSYVKEEGVVLIKGRFDKEKLLALAGMEKELKETDYEGHTLYEGGDRNDRFFGCFYRDGMIVASNKQKLVQEALDVLSGNKDSLADRGRLKGLRDLPEGTFGVVTANGFDKLPELDPQAQIMKKAERITITAGEYEGDAFVEAVLTASDERTADQVRAVLEGLVAMGHLMGHEEPELVELLKGLKVQQEDRTIYVRKTHPVDELVGLMLGLEKKSNRW